MRLSLIGHSGIGKSYWAKALEAIGFVRFCCDSMIEERLGLADIHDVARWMGQPYDPQYPEHSRQYLALEEEALRAVFADLRTRPNPDDPIVVDTTGSLIYLDESTRHSLAALTTVVYLETPPSVVKQMYELYCKEPKPVIWANCFTILPWEGMQDALRRCYPELLRYRAECYEAYADVVIPYEMVRQVGFTVQAFLEFVRRGRSASMRARGDDAIP